MDDDVLCVACFGDSLTWGYCQRGRLAFPYGVYLEQLMQGKAIVHSFGENGAQTKQLKLTLRPKVFNGNMKYDVVVILAGTNDLGYNVEIDVIIGNLKDMGKIVRENGAVPFFMSVPAIGKDIFMEEHLEKQKELNAEIQQLCSDEGYIFIDLFTFTVDKDGKMLLLDFVDTDGLHFSKNGYVRMGEVVYQTIVEWKQTTMATQ